MSDSASSLAKRLGALVFVAAAVSPLALGLVAAAVAERSLASGVRGAATAVIFFFPVVMLGVAFLPLVLDPMVDTWRRVRTPAAVAGWMLVQAIWLLPAFPGFQRLDCCEYQGFVQSELKNLASLEDEYLQRNQRYSDSFEAIGFTPSNGVDTELDATDRGWSARSTWTPNPDFTCAVWGGEVPEPLENGLGGVSESPFEIACGRRPVPESYGSFGRFLESYHGWLESGWFTVTFL